MDVAIIIAVTTGIMLIPAREFQSGSIHQVIIVTPAILRGIIITQAIIVHPLDFMEAGFVPG